MKYSAARQHSHAFLLSGRVQDLRREVTEGPGLVSCYRICTSLWRNSDPPKPRGGCSFPFLRYN